MKDYSNKTLDELNVELKNLSNALEASEATVSKRQREFDAELDAKKKNALGKLIQDLQHEIGTYYDEQKAVNEEILSR